MENQLLEMERLHNCGPVKRNAAKKWTDRDNKIFEAEKDFTNNK